MGNAKMFFATLIKADVDMFNTDNIITTGDYVDVEFSGTVLFGAPAYPVKEAVNVIDNVWRIFFDDWAIFEDSMEWETTLTYVGSQEGWTGGWAFIF